jgi:hypothetical protein
MARKRNHYRDRSKASTLATVRGIAGVERAEALALGGQQAVIYRSAGVKASVTTDSKKRASKRACRDFNFRL